MLKKALTPKLSLLFVSVLLLQNSVAEDYTQWELPEGAKARLGKGVMWEIQRRLPPNQRVLCPTRG